MEDFNIEYYRNYETVTIAEYVVAKENVEKLFTDSIKKGKIKDSLKYAGIYIELDKLLNKRTAYSRKSGYGTR